MSAFCASVIAMLPSCDFSSPIVGRTFVFDPTNFQNDLGGLSNFGCNVSLEGYFGNSDEIGSPDTYPYEIFKSVIIFREIIYIPHLCFVLGGSLCLCCHPWIYH